MAKACRAWTKSLSDLLCAVRFIIGKQPSVMRVLDGQRLSNAFRKVEDWRR
jgi:hypothetical protein